MKLQKLIFLAALVLVIDTLACNIGDFGMGGGSGRVVKE
jgi:hypothetical protein